MMLWQKSVGESRLDCSRVMVLDRRRRVDQKTRGERMEDEGVECWQMELAKWNIQLDETIEIGRGVVVQ